MEIKELWDNPEHRQKLAVAAIAILLLGAGYQLYRSMTRTVESRKIVPLVRTFTVGGVQSAQAAAVYPGEVRGRYESTLAFQVGGRINARHVNVGDSVTSGQVLMTLDPKDVAQSVEAAQAQLASATANQKLAADNAKRYQALYAQGAVSEAIHDQYNTQLEAANAALRQAQAQANSTGNQLSYTQLVSDADGVIASLSGEMGQVTAAGTPMATIVHSGDREIQINLPEGVRCSVGQRAKITFWALPDATVEGSVREIAPMADSVTRTYKVRIAVPQLPAAAKLGMTAKVELAGAAMQQGVQIPAIALYNVNNKSQVWVVRDKHAQLADVKIAGYAGNNIIVTEGLQQGDVVITAGLSKLTPALEVRTDESGEAK